jgi:hypothetical protein
MKKYSYLCFLLLFLFGKSAYSTHNVSGEISYRPLDTMNIPCLKYEITITTYTDMTSQADRCSLNVIFGDGTSALFDRNNGDASTASLCPSGFGGVPLGTTFPCGGNFKKNIYKGIHTYAGPGNYWIIMKDPNNAAGICNILNSVNVQFVLQGLLVINNAPGGSKSAIFNTIPVACGCVNTCFYYQPQITVAAGDSMVTYLASYTDSTGAPLPAYSLPPSTPNGSLWMNSATGDIEWCSPRDICLYDLCVRADHWKTVSGQTYYLGYVTQLLRITTAANSGTNICSDGIAESAAAPNSIEVYPNPS